MKTMLRYPVAVAALTVGLGFTTLAGPSSGRVDFGKFTAPGDGGQFVDIQISSNLLALTAQLFEKQQPEAAKLLRSVQLVRVNVVGLTKENRAEMAKRVRQIRHDLQPQGWEQNVMVQEKNGEDVGIYTKTRGGEALEGLVITVIEPKDQVVLINIVGDIRPDQVAVLGDKLNIKPLKDIGAALKSAAPKDMAAEDAAPGK
jgi:hypothetical protein